MNDEGMESELEEVDVEVIPSSSAAAASGSTPTVPETTTYDYDYDWDSIALNAAGLDAGDDGYASNMEVEQEESEEDWEVETDYGSVAMVNEDFTVFENLDEKEYDDYRFMLLGEGRGVEHYIVRKLAFLRTLPVTRDIWIGIQELFAMHKSVQLGGVEVRQRAIRYLIARRRYHFWYDQGRVQPGERLEESDMPEEWMAAHYGWGQPTEDQPYEDRGDIESWSPSEAAEGGEESGEVRDETLPPPVVTEEPVASSNEGNGEAAPSGSTTAAGSKGKCGGKGRTITYCRDPPKFDEADDYV